MKSTFRLALAATVIITGLASASAATAAPLPASAAAAGGTTLWTRLYTHRADSTDSATLAVSPDGSAVFVTGAIAGEHNPSGTCPIVGYDATTGAELWVAEAAGPNILCHLVAITVSPDGSTVYATGAEDFRGAGEKYLTVAYSTSTGTLFWHKWYTGAGTEGEDTGASSISVSPDGTKVFVTGRNGTSADATVTLAYDAASGVLLWAERSPGSGGDAVTVDPSGSAVYMTSTDQPSYITIAYAPTTGATLWQHTTHTGSGHYSISPASTAVSPDGSRLFLRGYGSTIQPMTLIAALDTATGNAIWIRRSPAAGAGEGSVLVSPDSTQLVVSGSGLRTNPAGATDYTVEAYNAATGQLLWMRHYIPYGMFLAGTAAAMSPDGATVYVIGSVYTSGDKRAGVETVAYSTSTGTMLWRAFHTGGEIGDVVVSPTGTEVFVTDNHTNGFLTLAYAP